MVVCGGGLLDSYSFICVLVMCRAHTSSHIRRDIFTAYCILKTIFSWLKRVQNIWYLILKSNHIKFKKKKKIFVMISHLWYATPFSSHFFPFACSIQIILFTPFFSCLFLSLFHPISFLLLAHKFKFNAYNFKIMRSNYEINWSWMRLRLPFQCKWEVWYRSNSIELTCGFNK